MGIAWALRGTEPLLCHAVTGDPVQHMQSLSVPEHLLPTRHTQGESRTPQSWKEAWRHVLARGLEMRTHLPRTLLVTEPEAESPLSVSLHDLLYAVFSQEIIL